MYAFFIVLGLSDDVIGNSLAEMFRNLSKYCLRLDFFFSAIIGTLYFIIGYSTRSLWIIGLVGFCSLCAILLSLRKPKLMEIWKKPKITKLDLLERVFLILFLIFLILLFLYPDEQYLVVFFVLGLGSFIVFSFINEKQSKEKNKSVNNVERVGTTMTKTENLWKTYEAINQFIRFADTKATAILAVNGVIAGFYFSNIGTIQTILEQKPIAFMPLAVAMASVVISVVFSAYCIIPRLKMNKSNCLIFFYDIAKNYPTASDYEKAIKEEISDEKIDKYLADQIWANSKIAVKKYNAVDLSIVFFVVTVIASIVFGFMAFWR